MLEFAAISAVGLIIALLLAALVYLVASWIGAPQPIAAILAVLMFLLVLLGGVDLEGAEAKPSPCRSSPEVAAELQRLQELAVAARR